MNLDKWHHTKISVISISIKPFGGKMSVYVYINYYSNLT